MDNMIVAKDYGNDYQEVMAILILIMIPFIIIGLICLIVQLIAKWKMFKKAGVAGWKVLIPFYGAYNEYKIAGKNYWTYFILYMLYVACNFLSGFLQESNPVITALLGFVLFLIGIAMLVVGVIKDVSLSKSFGHSGAFAVGLIFLPTIFYSILGFSKNQYIGTTESNQGPVQQ